jgi:hypothetical protein
VARLPEDSGAVVLELLCEHDNIWEFTPKRYPGISQDLPGHLRIFLDLDI